MAKLEVVRYQQHHHQLDEGRVSWCPTNLGIVEDLPQLFWEDHSPWTEANLWAIEQITNFRLNLQSVRSNLMHIADYAKWLEQEDTNWWHFPERASERCLTKYRGHLIRRRNDGDLAASTATQRMSAVIRFYRWLQARRLISPNWPMWEDKSIGIKVKDKYGLDHTLSILSTDLTIPNRKVSGAVNLEDGLLPVSPEDASAILDFADANAPVEIGLILRIGFLTGMRLATICDLKVQTLESATPFPGTSWKCIYVGPGAKPPVQTKFDINGTVLIPEHLLDQLIQYSTSIRRIKRTAKAESKNKNLIFLTRFGSAYTGSKSRAINVAMSRLREKASNHGISAFHGFKFHRTRATFATNLMRIALQYLPPDEAIQLVRGACLHKSEKTTLSYISFIETTEVMQKASEEFFQLFTGVRSEGYPT